MDGGNLGARPKPPLTASKSADSPATAVAVTASHSASPPAAPPERAAAFSVRAWEICPADSRTLSLSSRQARATASTSVVNCGRGK